LWRLRRPVRLPLPAGLPEVPLPAVAHVERAAPSAALGEREAAYRSARARGPASPPLREQAPARDHTKFRLAPSARRLLSLEKRFA
jgi:hypothetical protein